MRMLELMAIPAMTTKAQREAGLKERPKARRAKAEVAMDKGRGLSMASGSEKDSVRAERNR
jgi:hypothetical protein